jgi:hypothetical protein
MPGEFEDSSIANQSHFLCRVNPLYYVTFTTFTLVASFILFRGFNTSDPVNTISLLCGFLVIFSGVYLLNLSREDPDGRTFLGEPSPGLRHGFDDAVPTDSLAAFGTRRSMQSRRSLEGSRGGHSRRVSWGSNGSRGSLGDRAALMDGFGLDDLAEGSDEEGRGVEGANGKRVEDEEMGLRGGGQSAIQLARLSGSGRARSNVEKEALKTPVKGVGRGE